MFQGQRLALDQLILRMCTIKIATDFGGGFAVWTLGGVTARFFVGWALMRIGDFSLVSRMR